MGKIRSTRVHHLFALSALAIMAAACGGGGGDDVASDTSSTADSPPASTATTEAGATSTPPSSDDTVTAPSTIGDGTRPPAGCDEAGTITGDVDGDGQSDRVIHHMTADGATLEVCTWYFSGSIPGIGQAEFAALADVDADGTEEIFFGSTTAGSRMVQIAHVDQEGNIVVLNTDDGTPLVLTDGYPDGRPPDGHRFAYGCVAASDGVPAHLVAMDIEPINPAVEGGYRFERTPYTLEFGIAHAGEVEGYDVADLSPGGTSEELAALADGVARTEAPPCL
jgi:hypothetical protein